MPEQPAKSTSEPGKKRRWVRGLVVSGAVTLAVVWFGPGAWEWLTIPADAPVIAVSYDTAWHAQIGITTKNYEIALVRAGARTLELNPAEDDPRTILNQVDALLLAGGGDVDPDLYNGDAGAAKLVDRQRDDFELALIREALSRNIPILGVCRGIQILNVAHGGTLVNLRHDSQRSATHSIGIDSMAAHEVEIEAGSRIGQLLGSGRQSVNSFHGQAVLDPGRGIRVTARATDGVIEGIELPDQEFCIAVQWHPEVPPQQDTIWAALLDAAREYRQRRTTGSSGQ
jgi:gamma-glutamyl-gamma-aminobutyrate hydrolase PuuD